MLLLTFMLPMTFSVVSVKILSCAMSNKKLSEGFVLGVELDK